MEKERKNQLVRQGKVTAFASIAVSASILARHVKLVDGINHVPKTDINAAIEKASADLMAYADDQMYAEVYLNEELAKSIILSLCVVQHRDPKLFDGVPTDEQRVARQRSLKAHANAQALAKALKKDPSVEKFRQTLSGFDCPELAYRMLTSPAASSKIVTLEGKRLEPIDFPPKKLNSVVNHQVRIAVDEVAASGTFAMVTITSAKDATAVALQGLFRRSVRLNFKGFDEIPNLPDVMLSLRLVRREAEIIVGVTRAVRDVDKDLDVLVLKQFLGLKELAVEVPEHVQLVQKKLWDGLL